MSGQLNIGIGWFKFCRTNLNRLCIGSLPSFKLVASVWIIRVNGKTKGMSFQVGVGIFDAETLLSFMHIIGGDGTETNFI